MVNNTTLTITSHHKPLNRQKTTYNGVEIQIPDLDMHSNVGVRVKHDNGLPSSLIMGSPTILI